MSFRTFSLFLILAAAAAVHAADPPVILSIEPDSVPATGGYAITILGRNLDLPPNFACFAPCPPRVRFGDAEVAAREHTNERLVVLAPPHAAGKVDVTVITGDGRTTTRPGAFTYVPSHEATAWEKVLVPIYFEKQLPGGAGSLWETQFRLRAGAEVEVAPVTCSTPCPPIYPSRIGVRAGETLTKLPAAPPQTGEGRGRLFFVSRHAADEVSVQARVADLSRGRSDAGTEIPIVREKQLRRNAMQLLNVPFDPVSFRYRLRIYEASNVPTSFRVRVIDEGPNAKAGPLLEFIAQTSSPDPQPEFRSEPFYYETDLGSPLRPVLPAGTVRVEVLPLAPWSQAWAMLTITSVDGNHVTLVTPQ